MVSLDIGVRIQTKIAIVGRWHVYLYLNESLCVPPTILEMYSRRKNLLTACFCSEKERLEREKVVELCFKDSLAFVFRFQILKLVSWM